VHLRAPMSRFEFIEPEAADALGDGAAEAAGLPSVWIVEDEPAAAELAADLCVACGAQPELFRSALPFLRAFRAGGLPRAIVLDWRLERELSAALFLATRHRFPALPVIYWTGTPDDALPSAVRDDPCTRIVDKAAGADAFDTALSWALASGS
jgi:DNA-binding NtrC family response regulator